MDFYFFPTRGNRMESTQVESNPNEGGINLDPVKDSGEMKVSPSSISNLEVAGPSAPHIPSPSPDEEQALLHSEGEEETEGAVAALDSLSLKQKRQRLPGSAKRNLRKLIESGVPYESALKQVVSRLKSSPEGGAKPTPTGKRLHSDGSTPELRAKRPKSATTQTVKPKAVPVEQLSYKAAVSGVKVGLIHHDYPAQQFSAEEVVLLRREVISAVDRLYKSGVRKQIRFESCAPRPGWLLVTCADAGSTDWLLSAASSFRPWDGAQIKAVVGKDIPRPLVCVAYIPDDEKDTPLSRDTVLGRLEMMNDGLPTAEWTVLNSTRSGPGQTWTFAIDEVSVKALEDLGWRPYFGFGRVQFRLKDKQGEGKSSPAEEKAVATVTVAPPSTAGPSSAGAKSADVAPGTTPAQGRTPGRVVGRGLNRQQRAGARSAPRGGLSRGKPSTSARGSGRGRAGGRRAGRTAPRPQR